VARILKLFQNKPNLFFLIFDILMPAFNANFFCSFFEIGFPLKMFMGLRTWYSLLKGELIKGV